MVKRLLLFSVLWTSFSFSQRFELGIGGKGNFNWIQSNDEFLSDVIDSNGDTLFMNFDQTKIKFSYSIPIFVRFRTKFGFWSELAFTTEKLNVNVSGTANYSNSTLNSFAVHELIHDYQSSQQDSYEEFYDQYYSEYLNKEVVKWKEQLDYQEVTQFNNVALNFGYTFLRTKKFRPFVLLGFEWNSRTNKNHYQSLDYTSLKVEDYSQIYRELPRLNSHLFFLNFGGGIELHNLQLGFNLRQSVGQAQEYEFNDEINVTSNSQSNLYQNITSASIFLKYSLFNFNARSSADRKKLKREELKVLGDFKEKNKLIKLSIGAHVPIFTNVNSLYDHLSPSDTFTIDSHSSLTPVPLTENVWITHKRTESGVDDFGQFQTVEANTMIGLGRIKRISIFPKLGFAMEYEPIKYFSYETSLNYQFTEYDTEATFYNFGYDWDNNAQPYQTIRSTALRQTLHTFSIGQKINLKYDVSPDLYLGISGGVNFNFFAPGKYKFENPGYNSELLFEDFDNFIFRGDLSKNFNSKDNGTSSESYGYEYYSKEQETFMPVSNKEVMTVQQGRFWMSYVAGIDIYFQRLRISPYIEGRITDINFLYRDYLSGGISFSFYLRK